MRRPILIVTLGFIIGIIWGLYFNIALFVFAILLLLLILNTRKCRNVARIIKVFINKTVIILFVLSFFIGNIYIKYLENDYEKTYNSLEDINIVGTIISEKEEKQYSDMYIIKVEKINDKKINNKKFYISVKNNKINLKYGDKVYIEGEYIKPSKQRNYKGFDYSRYLKTLNIYGTIKQSGEVKIIKENNLNFVFLLSNNLKNAIIKNVEKLFPENTKGIFFGILLGYTDLIQEETKEDFSNSSLSHLLAVSGAHVSYVVLGLSIFLKFVKIPKKIKNILISLFLIFYLFIIGFTPSVTRAVIMSIISIIQLVFYKKQDTLTTISFSSLIILINNPYSLFNIGFLLSYFGTIGIIVFIDKFKNVESSKNKIVETLQGISIVTISAQILILPILVYYFNTISLSFIVSNLIAGVLIGPITVIGLIIILISFINTPITLIIAKFYNVLLIILLETTKLIANMSISKIYVKTPSIVLVIIYYLAVLIISIILVIKKSNRLFLKSKINKFIFKFKDKILKEKNKIFICILLILIIFFVLNKIPQNLKIHFIDVGQGDSTLIITPTNKTILIDSGGSESYDIGKNTVLPYLLDRGITRLDYIFISHFDTDHCKGFEYILENIKVKNVIIGKQFKTCENYEKFIEIVKKNNIKVVIVEAKQKIKIEKDLYVDVLWPSSDGYISDNAINNNSLVCKLVYKDFSMLFTGDIEEIAEKAILKEYEGNSKLLKSTVLKAAHHGSKTSSTKEFIKAVSPKIALIGVGENNKFGHPNDITLENLKAIDCKIFRTDKNGEITIQINSKKKIWIDKMLN